MQSGDVKNFLLQTSILEHILGPLCDAVLIVDCQLLYKFASMIHTRQLAAIMFTDIEGYTTLMQQNEERAIQARHKHRHIFNSMTEKHNGRVLQYFGDGTLSIFNSAIDAVGCGIEMQLGFLKNPAIPVRIGIHTGDIILHEDEIIGDGVNIASRIESLAVPGSIFISDKVFDEIKNQEHIKISRLKTFKLKNVEKPIEVYAISNVGLVVPKSGDIKGDTGTEISSLPENQDGPKSKGGSLAMLLTKIHMPSPGKNLVHRSKLFEKLSMGLNRKLILVSAPAGFGKTTLISDWINHHKIPTAWYSLDKRDNDSTEFLNYIIAGIRNIKSDFGESSEKLLNAPVKPNIESITSMLINDTITIEEDFILVLDDFHLINSPEIIDIVKFLLEHIPVQMHIVISTRSDPPLPIARLRSQNQLMEVRLADLSFSTNDISIFFNKKLKLGLSIDDVFSLESKTEGWIAGLQLAALSMKGRSDITEFINAFAGDNRYIMDYLIEEILNMQSDDVKDFLLRTSILEQISRPLCDTILNISTSQSIIEYLDKNNMFIVPLDNERHCYRYHHLFADLLKQRLFLGKKDEVNELHNKASLWFEENGKFVFAIDHALEAENFERAMQLLTAIVEKLWENGHHEAILKFGDILPDEIIEKNSNFCLFYSWILISSGQLQKAEKFLIATEKLAIEILANKDQTESKVLDETILGKISVVYAYLLSGTGKTEKIFHYCEQAEKYLNEYNPLWYSWAWFSYGVAYLSIGKLQESTKAYKKALEYGKKSGNLYLISTTVIRIAYGLLRQGLFKSAYKHIKDLLKIIDDGGYADMAKVEWSYAGLFSILSYIQYMWNEHDEAIQNAKLGFDLCKKGNDITLKVFGAMVYSRAMLSEGDSKNAKKTIDELFILMKSKEIPPYLQLTSSAWRIDVLIEQNQLDQANDIIQKLDLKIDGGKTYTNELIYIAYARLMISEYKLNDAEKLLLQLHPNAEAGKRIERLIEIKILLAIQYKLKGETKKAINYLSESIVLAAEENLIMFFLSEGDAITDLLNEINKKQAISKTNIPKAFFEKIMLAFETRKKRIKDNATEALSDRELEVLKLIAANFSNQEIADKLFVSINTVKTHAKNIHLKLEVNNRTKAVSRAKELGLL